MSKGYDVIDRIENSRFVNGIDKTTRFLSFMSGILVACCIFAMVLMRYVFKTDIFGMEEVILTITFWFYFCGATNGSRENSQIKADLIGLFVKDEKTLWYRELFVGVVEVIVIAFLTYLSFWLLKLNLVRMPATTALKIPQIVPQAAIDLGFVLMFVYTALRLLKTIFSYPSGKNVTTEE